MEAIGASKSGADVRRIAKTCGAVAGDGQPENLDRNGPVLLGYLGSLLSAISGASRSGERYARGSADKTSTTR